MLNRAVSELLDGPRATARFAATAVSAGSRPLVWAELAAVWVRAIPDHLLDEAFANLLRAAEARTLVVLAVGLGAPDADPDRFRELAFPVYQDAPVPERRAILALLARAHLRGLPDRTARELTIDAIVGRAATSERERLQRRLVEIWVADRHANPN